MSYRNKQINIHLDSTALITLFVKIVVKMRNIN